MSGPRDRKDSSSFEDLFDELEQWDSTFDSLHDPPSEVNLDELVEGLAVDDDSSAGPPIEVPASSLAPASNESITTPPPAPGRTEDSVAAVQLDALTGDSNTAQHAGDVEATADLGGAADSVNTAPTRPPPIADVDDVVPEPRDPFAADVGESGGYGRPAVPLAVPSSAQDISKQRLPAASVSRSSPAIVSRAELAKRRAAQAEAAKRGELAGDQPDVAQPNVGAKRELFAPVADFDDDPVQEWEKPSITNVMAKETVDKMVETAAAFFDDQPDENLFELDGDFYDDIEIDESESAPQNEIEAPASITAGRRTMAHVVRRKTATEAQVPVYVDPAFGGPLAEVDTAVRIDELALAESRSDSAAAVAGVLDELGDSNPSGELQSPWSDEDNSLVEAGAFHEESAGRANVSDGTSSDFSDFSDDDDDDDDDNDEAEIEIIHPVEAGDELDSVDDLDSDEELESVDDVELQAGLPEKAPENVGADRQSQTVVPPPVPIDPLASLSVDIPPQLPAPRSTMAIIGLSAIDPSGFTQNGELESLDESVGDQLQDALLAMSVDGGERAEQQTDRKSAVARWASGLARYLGDVEDAHRYAETVSSDASGNLARLRKRELLASQGLWAEVIDELGDSDGAATLAAELRLALDLDSSGVDVVEKTETGTTSSTSDQNVDAAICLRQFIAHARHLLRGESSAAGSTPTEDSRPRERAGLSKTGRALGGMVADDELAAALRAISMAADPEHARTELEALAASENPSSQSPMSIDIWDLATRAKLEPAIRANLATAIAQSSSHATASTFHLIAAGLFAAAGDRASERASVSAAADDSSHPLVVRSLLSSSELPDAEESDYLVAVASGTSAAPLAARALWRSSLSLSGNKRREMVRRAVALDSTSRFLVSELEELSASVETGSEDLETEVSLALAPSVESGSAVVLNRLRLRVDGSDRVGQTDGDAIVEDPAVMAVLEHSELRFLGTTHLACAAEIARAGLGTERASGSSSHQTAASAFTWRSQVVDKTRALTDTSTDSTGEEPTASTASTERGASAPARWRGLPPSALLVSASAVDRISARIALFALDPRASSSLAKASESWPLVGGRVAFAVGQLAAELDARKRTSDDDEPDPLTPLSEELSELSDPRVQWLGLWQNARSGDWQAASESLSSLGDDVSRYRGAHLLFEHGNDAASAAELADGLVVANESSAPRAPRADVFRNLAAAARRTAAIRSVAADEASDGPRPRKRAARSSVAPSHDAFAAAIRDGEASEAEKDFAAAFACYHRALELRPDDPIATQAIFWAAAASGEVKAAAAIALSELRAAEDERDPGARADAYETLARLDAEVSGDEESSVLAWESAAETDPMRTAALRALEKSYLRHGKNRELLVVYGRLLAIVDDRTTEAALLSERARIANLCERDPAEIARDYRAILELDAMERMPLFLIEQRAHLDPPSVDRADLLSRAALVLGGDVRSKAAFLCRSAEIRTIIGDYSGATESFRAATEAAPGHLPSLSGWREVAWRAEDWNSFATACELESEVTTDDSERGALFHLAGVAMMDKALDGPEATRLLKSAMALGATSAEQRIDGGSPEPYSDSFARLRLLFDEVGNDEALGDLLRSRLESETEIPVRLALHLELAQLCRNFWDDREGASAHLAEALKIEPNHHAAVAELSDISWELGAWDTAADTLLKRASLERDPDKLKHIFYRLGTIYADHLPDPKWAIRCFTSSLTYDPDDTQALERLAALSFEISDYKTALGASERLLKSGISNEEKVRHLHRVAEIQAARGAHGAAERAVRVAFDLAPHSKAALVAMVNFYQEAGDISSIRVNLDRAAQAMRARFAADREDDVALAVIARVLTVRERAGVRGSERVGQIAAELARAVGDDSAEIAGIAGSRPPARPRTGAMVGPEMDSVLVGNKVPLELLHIMRALRSRIGKFVSADPKRFGVGRGDRLKRGRHPVANLAREMATELGLRGVDVYVSSAALGAAIAVPTDPISIVLGSRFASLDRAAELTFALGRGLALGQLGLALVDIMTPDDLDLLIGGIIRQFAPEYQGFGQTEEQLAGEQHRLRRLFSSSLSGELRHHALALTGLRLEPGSLHSAFRQVGLRAGLVATTNAAGALAATLRIGGYSTIQEAGDDPEVAELLRFSTSEEHVEIQAAIAASSS